ncbi:MAG: 30S ribosomal protein S18 [Anaerolineae bacterium]|nr:30S ribosomal protein S18 [Anaerolineae bacterium]
MSDNDFNDYNDEDRPSRRYGNRSDDRRSSGGGRGGDRDRDRDRDRGGRGRPRRGGRRRREDYFDANQTTPNYKDVDTLRRFMTERAKIRPRRQTGLTSKNQRKLAREIKRARHLALLPFTDEQSRG